MEDTSMKKRLFSLFLACVMIVSLLPLGALRVSAATKSPNSPYALIEYGYSGTVTCGTVRYVSQVSYDSYFYSAYWPSGTFGYYTGPSVECGTASISMALSYIGINKTPNDILTPNNGATNFAYGWGGSTYKSYPANALTTAMSNYINGGGKYSPPVIHIPGYSAAGHYVVVVGQISSNTYQILDPWQRACTSMTVNGSSATYYTYYTIYDTIDQIHQWYNPNASIDNDVTATFDANGGSCATSSRKVNEGSAIGTLPTPTRSGYDFVGWYTSRDGGTAPITASTTIAKDTTYYAHWTSRRSGGNKITFNANGGTLPGASATYTVTGTNTYRNTNDLIVFNCDGQTVASNYYGTEVAVDAGGKVIAKRPYQSNETLTVPNGGFVLSGHGNNTGMCTAIAAIHLGDHVSYDANAKTVTVYSDPDAILAGDKYVTSGSTYGDLPVPTLGSTPFLGWYTAASGGTRITDTSAYSASTLYARWGCDHSFTVTNLPTDCGDYPSVLSVCSKCGFSSTYYDDAICSEWSETKPGGDWESKTQYAYRDYETTTSSSASLPGYTQTGSEWVYKQNAANYYVTSWPSGFSTSNSLYKQYSNPKKTTGETATAKTAVTSDQVAGYLYYHWCYSGSVYSVAASSGSYTTFHAYYSTTAPDTYTCDTSDMSYKTSNTGCCTNSNWFFVVDVNAQNVVEYEKLFLYERWTDYSDWSDTPLVGGGTRQVKTRTIYHTPIHAPQTHNWVNGSCTNCGDTCYHTWLGSKCTNCDLICSHSWANGNCSVCGTVCSHSWTNGSCINCGLTCSHSWNAGSCGICGQKDSKQALYLFDYINGAPYGYEEDYATLGSYQFTEGSLVATFAGDSYVGIKTADNGTLYMTDGYLGKVTGARLYSSTTLSAPDLLYVPGGVEITFTLTDNEDGTLTLRYQAALPPASLAPKYPSLSFEDEVFINIFFAADNLGDLGTDDMGLITWSSAKADGTIETAENIIPGAVFDSSQGLYCARTQGIVPQALSDTVYCKVYLRLQDGSYIYTKLLDYSPKTYALNTLNNAYSTKAEKAVAVSMLNWGAQAQIYFGYKPYNLMNSSLTAAQKALVTNYSSSLVSGIRQPSASKVGIFTNSGGFTRRYPTVTFEGAFSINYFFVPANVPDGYVTMYYWTQEDYDAVSTLTPANATGVLRMSSTTGTYETVVRGIAAKDLDQTVYVAAGYVSGGTSYCTGVLAYSIGSYCVSQAATADAISPFAQATAVYGYYAKQYFC